MGVELDDVEPLRRAGSASSTPAISGEEDVVLEHQPERRVALGDAPPGGAVALEAGDLAGLKPAVRAPRARRERRRVAAVDRRDALDRAGRARRRWRAIEAQRSGARARLMTCAIMPPPP